MSGLDIRVGQKFVQKRQAYGDRRVIEIDRVDYSYVQAISWWQVRVGNDTWADVAGRRRTRLLISTVRERFDRLEES